MTEIQVRLYQVGINRKQQNINLKNRKLNRKYISKSNNKKHRGATTLYILIGIALLGALYFHFHADYIYAQLGNWYFKHNEISRAQAFYEKAFRLGYNDSAAREIYVNSIINSPLTVDSQEKLAAIAEDKIQDNSSLKAKEFLYELKREIHRQYSDNYIKQAPFNRKILRWNRFPITYTFKNSGSIPAEYIDEINRAFSEWEKYGVVLFTGVEGEADIVVNFRSIKNESMEFGRKYVVAYTVPVVINSTLKRMDINFYNSDPEGNLFSRNQIYNTALHEIFHALGFMGHSFSPDNIMYLAKDNNTLINDNRAKLTEADINTLKLLYKIKPDITNSDALESEYISYLVIGDDMEINVSKAKEAKNYIYHAPTLPSGYIDLAESLVVQKRYPEAIKNLEKALRLADTDEMKYIVYYNLAVAYYYINHTSLALEYLNNAAQISDSEELHLLKAEILLKVNTKEAIKEYVKLNELYPDNADYVRRLANLYIQNKNYLQARKVLKSYLKTHPEERDNERFSTYKILLLFS